MKNVVRCHLFLVALVVPAAWATSAGATVLWTATFEKGDLSEWMPGPNPTKTLPGGVVRKNIEVLGEQVYSGKFACKVTLHPDDTFGQYNQNRSDIKHTTTLTGEGKDSYLSGHYFLPEDAKTRNQLFFYETNSSFRNWMDLWVEPKAGGGTAVKFGIESNGANLGSVLLWTGDWTAGRWHQIAIHVHWSTNAQLGQVDLWFDGQQVITARKHKTKFDNNDLFFETGIHRVLPQQFTETVYFDDFIEADTLAEIKIGAPVPGGGSDGGTSDAAGGGDSGGGQGGSGGSATDAGGSGGSGGGAGGSGGGAAGSTGSGGGPGGSGGGAAGATGSGGTTVSGSGGTTGAAGAGGNQPAASGGSGCAIGGGSRASGPGLPAIFELISGPIFGLIFGLVAIRLRRRR